MTAMTVVSWAAGACFAVLVVLVLAKIAVGELMPAATLRPRVLDVASAVVAVLLVALLALRILIELG